MMTEKSKTCRKKKKSRGLKITLSIVGGFFGVVLLLLLVVFPITTRPRTELTPLAQQWQDTGSYIQWNSTLPENSEFGELNIFTIQMGNLSNPAILFIHGYPTHSFDFKEMMELLSTDYYVCAIDTPGYGLSDKPKRGYTYSIFDDSKLIDHYIREILGLTNLTLITHDKGDSVGLALLDMYQAQSSYTINHHIITNGNVFLPLANLTWIQKALLNQFVGPILTKYMNGDLYMNGINREAHNIPESQEIVDAHASIFDWEDGGEVQHKTIQYLDERVENEEQWLLDLNSSTIPTTLIWGMKDNIAPTRVADHVWNTSLKDRSVSSLYWRLPTAHHYLQNDYPEIMSDLVRLAMGETIDLTFSSYLEQDRPILYGNNTA